MRQSAGPEESAARGCTGANAPGTRLHTAAPVAPRSVAGRWALRRGQTVERADHLPHSRQGNVRVQGRGPDAMMAQQGLDRAGVDSCFQEMRGMAVAQSVGSDPRQSRVAASPLAGFLHRRRVQRLVEIRAREQPLRRPRFTPVGTQFYQELRGRAVPAVPSDPCPAPAPPYDCCRSEGRSGARLR